MVVEEPGVAKEPDVIAESQGLLRSWAGGGFGGAIWRSRVVLMNVNRRLLWRRSWVVKEEPGH